MAERPFLTEKELAALAGKYRVASGKNRAEAAREMGVARQAIIYAEDHPDKSFTKLRCRMIAAFSPYKIIGPVFLAEKK